MRSLFAATVRSPLPVLALLLLVTAAAGRFASTLEVKNSVNSLLKQDDESYLRFQRFLDEFGNEGFIVVAWDEGDGPAGEGFLSSRTLSRIDRLSHRLQAINDGPWGAKGPLVRQVISLTTLPDPVPGFVSVADGTPRLNLPAFTPVELMALAGALAEHKLDLFPPTPQKLADFAQSATVEDWRLVFTAIQQVAPRHARLRALYPGAALRGDDAEAQDRFLVRVRAMDSLRGLLLSADERTQALVVQADDITDDDAKSRFSDAVHEATERERQASLALGEQAPRFHVVGPPAFVSLFQRTIGSELLRFLPISLGVLGLVLLILTRSLRSTLIPLLVVTIGLAWTMGLIRLCGYKLNVSSTIIPPVLLTIGVANVVHIQHHLAHLRKLGQSFPEACVNAMAYMWVPCGLTSLTTAVGFLSLLVSGVRPIQEAGVFIAIGVMLSYAVAMLATPAVLAVLERRFPWRHNRVTESRHEWWSLGLGAFARAVLRRHRAVFALAGVVVLLSAVGIPRIQVETFLIKYFKPGSPVVEDHLWIESRLAGVAPLEIVIRGQRGAFTSVANLRALKALHDEIGSDRQVQRVTSLITTLENAFGGALPESDSQMRPLAALLSMPPYRDTVRSLVNEDFSAVHMSLRQRDQSSTDYRRLEERNAARFERLLSPLNLEASHTGTATLFFQSADNLVLGQVRSLGLALGIISLLMFALYRSVRLGLIALIPNLIPVAMLLGSMGLLGIPLNISTAMIASIAIGIAVDDTIHYLSRFRLEYLRVQDHHLANIAVMENAGPAMIHTSMILFFGFGVLTVSHFMPNVWMGVLTAITMANALIGDLVVLPVLLDRYRPMSKRESVIPEQPPRYASFFQGPSG